MSDLDALLAAVLADPADDTVRLAYADALDEHGRPLRSEFIRLSMHPLIGNRNRKPFRRMRKLGDVLYPEFSCCYGDHGRASMTYDNGWLREIFSDFIVRPQILFDRGFACEVRCEAESWMILGDAFCREHPITRVVLTTNPQICFSIGARVGRTELAGREIDPNADRATIQETMSARWKGVAFELPPAPPAPPAR